MNGVVYDPPRNGLPYLAVVLDNSGQVVVATSFGNPEAAEAFIAKTFRDFAESKGLSTGTY
ncbi:hypothetical protein EDF72_2598 [Delftia acidovorans]|uniref:hypothetical protein n=1 Tax=Delftia acidovorans TaxID=80866 RepID=UPI000FA649B2|nr:hypothetical protein [Delftia acidovorans]ROR01064.1 hypothetical protein EDF72_2598 [Delftia acidovorans]